MLSTDEIIVLKPIIILFYILKTLICSFFLSFFLYSFAGAVLCAVRWGLYKYTWANNRSVGNQN